jgi:hypothetical protein
MHASTLSKDAVNRAWMRFEGERSAVRASVGTLPPIREHHVETHAQMGEVGKHAFIMTFLVVALPAYLIWYELF